MLSDVLLHSAAAVAYLILVISLLLDLKTEVSQPRSHLYRHLWLALALVAQGWAIYAGASSGHTLQTNWAHGLSLMMWLGLLVAWVENNFLRLDNTILPLGILAIFVCVLAAVFPPGDDSIVLPASSPTLRAHLIIAMLAYSFVILAALQALLISWQDRFLRHPPRLTQRSGLFKNYIERQPPLLTQERLLFRFIGIGFIFITATLATGLMITDGHLSEKLFGNYKLFYSLISWLVFGVLLFGRLFWGWRGRKSLQWTWAGFAFLMLSFVVVQIVYS